MKVCEKFTGGETDKQADGRTKEPGNQKSFPETSVRYAKNCTNHISRTDILFLTHVTYLEIGFMYYGKIFYCRNLHC